MESYTVVTCEQRGGQGHQPITQLKMHVWLKLALRMHGLLTMHTYFLLPRGTRRALNFGNFYLIKRKCWGLMWWQLLLWRCWCWGLWERGLWLDWTHLHSVATRKGQVSINEDILIRKKKIYFIHENLRQKLPSLARWSNLESSIFCPNKTDVLHL